MCRVLIIDDEIFFAETIQLILEDAGEAEAKISTTIEDARKQVKKAMERGKPFEVFLIDQRLGPGKDGIEVMRELRAISPDTDAIIFTGIEDTENGVRAYEAGAFRYISKPFENRELLFLLKSLKQWRTEQREHGWQKLFSSMMEDALQHESFHDVSRVVVEYALNLGFSRAHLFWVPKGEDFNTHNLMVGITNAGEGCIPDFPISPLGTSLYPLNEWFDLGETKGPRDAIFLRLDQEDELRKQAEAFGYQWPRGETACLPLWSGESLLGALVLDHGQQETAISKHERSLLNLFSRQVAIVLENAGLISRERRSVQEMAAISHIGREIMAKAVEETNLSNLLEEVHVQMDLLMDVSDYAFFLLDPESNELDMRLLYERGIRHKGILDPSKTGIERFLLTKPGNAIFWPVDVHEQLRTHKINVGGEIPRSCMGVQLHVGKKIIGGITVKRFESEEQFTRRDYILLTSIGNQISGAIELLHANEFEKRDAERLSVLRSAMMEMLRIAQENEDDLWLTALTFATANFGAGFNRALLFLENEDRTALVGKAGIGTNDPKQARRDWEHDVQRNYQFDDFLAELEQKNVRYTDLHSLTQEIELQLTNTNSIVHQVLEDGQRKIIQEDSIEGKLPREIASKVPLAECAILPFLSGDRTIGVVIVDNKHNGLPLSEKMLDHLQTLLNYTGLVWETLHQQKKSESLLDANYQIMGEAGFQALRETLHNICETARTIMEADWVLVYPLKEGEEFIFDKENTAWAGQLKYPIKIKDRPSPNGISHHIMRTGKLMINDVHKMDSDNGQKHISTHEFIMQEGVKAVLGIAIHDVQRDEPLGIFYLNYRTPQNFSPTDEHHSVALANLAAVAISNARRSHRKRLEAAQKIAEAIGTKLDLPQMFRKVLQQLQGFFENTTLCILTYDEDENALRFAPSTLEFYKIQNPEYKGQDTFPLSGKSLACKVARRVLKTKHTGALNVANVEDSEEYLNLNPQTRSEVCVPLVGSKRELLGVLALERTRLHGFDEDDIALVETVAGQLSMAIERAQHSEQLAFKSTVAANYAWAAEIAHDINKEVGHIRNWAFLIKDTADENSIYSTYAEKIEESAAILSIGPWTNQPKQTLPFDQVVSKSLENIRIRKDITLKLELQCDGLYISANPLTFQRILKHLIRNASDGMIDIEREKIISISTKQLENNWVELQIEDSGMGVSEKARPYIFQRQYSTKDSDGGVGLLIVRQMVEEMDGKIRLLPQEPGKGAVFSIKLPGSVDVVDEEAGMGEV
jgi:GAF domain-containing protein